MVYIGSLNTIIKECKTFDYFPIVVFDGKLSKRRLEVYSNYKHHDEKILLENNQLYTDEKVELERLFRIEYNTQRDILTQLLLSMGIPTIRYDDWEGDDIIYILTKLSKDSIVVSDDKDMWQLVCENDERRCRIRRGMTDEFIDINYFKGNNITTDDFIACKAVVGDVSDNIPTACNGTGEKTALGLWKLYKSCILSPTVKNFPSNEEQLTEQCKLLNIPKRKAYLNFNIEQFINNMYLMDLDFVNQDVTEEILKDLEKDIKEISNNYNSENVNKILDYLQFKTIDIGYLKFRLNETYNFL